MSALAFVSLVIGMCLLATVSLRLQFYVESLRDRIEILEKRANQWEQLYRDCQAARQFSEPAHAADAVSDVTR